MDALEVRRCTHLKGKTLWFLSFNRGFCDGAGNPPNPDGLRTAYQWKQVLTRRGLTDIIENYAQVVKVNDDTGRKKSKKIFCPTTSSTWCGSCWPRPGPAERANGTGSSTQPEAATTIPSPGWRTN